MKLPLELYSTDEDAGVGAWVLLKVEEVDNSQCSQHGAFGVAFFLGVVSC